MSDPIKRIVLCRFWPGDVVYHISDGAKGSVLHVQFMTDRLVPRYFVVMPDRSSEWCEEMELSSEKVFESGTDEAKKKA